MSAIPIIDEVHLVVAFLVLLCAIILGWVQTGRRVMAAIIGLQVLIGIVYAAMLGPALQSVGPRIAEHILGAFLAMGAYIIGRRLGANANSRVVPILLSALGLLLALCTAYLGLKMHGRIG